MAPHPTGDDTTPNGWPHRPVVSSEVAARLVRAGELCVLGRMPWSSNATYLGEVVDDDGCALVVYKPQCGERPLWDFPTGTLCQREVAAYEVSAALGWDLVPDTTLREGPAGVGSVQRFVDHDPDVHYFELFESGEHHEELRRFAALDVVMNNTDRKGGHVIRSVDGLLFGIDHGVCFHPQWKLRTVIWDYGDEPIGEQITADLESLLASLDGDLGARLRELLSVFEVDAVRARTEHLLATRVFPAVDPGYHSYPWPLV